MTFHDLVDAVFRLAAFYVRRRGTQPETAVKMAVTAMLDVETPMLRVAVEEEALIILKIQLDDSGGVS